MSDNRPAYATAPFDHPQADIILRSSDNVNFRIFKLFLSLASPFFQTLFGIPQPVRGSDCQEIKEGLVVVPVTEDSNVLDTLLRFCYPCTLAEDPDIKVLGKALNVLEAARKYSLDIIEKKVRQAIVSPQNLEAAPLRCFAIARRGCLREETLLAARHTLTQPLIPSWFQQIELITSTDLLTLLTYHRKCGDAVYALKGDLSWIKSHYGSKQGCAWLSGKHEAPRNIDHTAILSSCQESLAPQYKLFAAYSHQWWEDFMEETFTALREKPCARTVASLAAKTVRSVKSRNCSICSPHITEGMRDFSELFIKKVEETVSRIKVDFLDWKRLDS